MTKNENQIFKQDKILIDSDWSELFKLTVHMALSIKGRGKITCAFIETTNKKNET